MLFTPASISFGYISYLQKHQEAHLGWNSVDSDLMSFKMHPLHSLNHSAGILSFIFPYKFLIENFHIFLYSSTSQLHFSLIICLSVVHWLQLRASIDTLMKTIVFIELTLVLILYISLFGQMYNDMYPPLQGHTE